jgi:hypothetical protein
MVTPSQKIAEKDRFYFNRVGYKDANINGTTATGGIVGLQTDGSLATVYDLGTINSGTKGDTTGALVGSQTGGTIKIASMPTTQILVPASCSPDKIRL